MGLKTKCLVLLTQLLLLLLNEVKNKIPTITNLATSTAPTTVENDIPNVSDLVQKKLIIRQKLVKLKKINYY